MRGFAFVTVGVLAAIAALNFLVNPWALYPARLVPPRVVDRRSEKCALLRRVQPPPEQLVLGSSRVMHFEPALLERLTGLRTFNAAVPGGMALDSHAFFRYATEACRAPVRSVVLGVDTLLLLGGPRSPAPLAACPELAPFVPAPRGSEAVTDRLQQLLSWPQTRDSLRTLGQIARRQAPPGASRTVLAGDGGELSFDVREARAQGLFNLKQVVRRELDAGFLNPHGLDGDALADLERLLADLRRRRVRVIAVLPPVVDAQWEHWRATGHLPEEAAARARVTALLQRYGARCADFSRVGAFGGDPGEFYDASHPTALNCRRMIQALFDSRSG